MEEETPRQNYCLTRAVRTLLFIDIVESTRLLELDENGTVNRWRQFVGSIENEILPLYSGRIVNSLGDGLLIDFSDVTSGVSAALHIQCGIGEANNGYPPESHLMLRMGIEVSNVLIDHHDVYGRGAMLGARLMTLAGPAECVVSENVRDQLDEDFSPEVTDLGECYLKHCKRPVRAYRIGSPGPKPVVDSGLIDNHLVPSIAVIPFEARHAELDHEILGEVFAEELIRSISRSQNLDVISRLSTRRFCGQEWAPQSLRRQLGVDYVLSGVYRVNDDKILVDVELAETKSGHLIWGQRLAQSLKEVISGEQDLVDRVVAEISSSIMSRELQRARTNPLPTLESYSLLMGGINLMHSMYIRDFMLSWEMLRTVADRATRLSVPNAWLAKWYVLRKQQGWSDDPEEDTRNAIKYCKSALDSDPESSLALAIDGLVYTHMKRDLDEGYKRYKAAVAANPNDCMAWLLKGAMHAFRGEGRVAVVDTQRALALSPLDPHRYYFESLAATAYLASRQYDRALECAQRSLCANPAHTSTLRAKAVAEWQLGDAKSARRTAQQLMKLEPDFTVSGWLKKTPSEPYKIGSEWAKILKDIRLPS